MQKNKLPNSVGVMYKNPRNISAKKQRQPACENPVGCRCYLLIIDYCCFDALLGYICAHENPHEKENLVRRA